MKSKWENFTEEELTCKCGCGQQEMDDDFMDKIQSIRGDAGFAFNVTSAYRCPSHNNNVSTTGTTGPHTTGEAIDIAVHGDQAHKLLKLALVRGMKGIGINQKGDHNTRFIHLDNLSSPNRPWVWTY